jgi:hypothetical protein
MASVANVLGCSNTTWLHTLSDHILAQQHQQQSFSSKKKEAMIDVDGLVAG